MQLTALYHLGCVSMFDLLLYGFCLNFINFFLEGRSLAFIDHTMF